MNFQECCKAHLFSQAVVLLVIGEYCLLLIMNDSIKSCWFYSSLTCKRNWEQKKIIYFEYYGHMSGQPGSEKKVSLPLKSYKEKQDERSVMWNGLSMR